MNRSDFTHRLNLRVGSGYNTLIPFVIERSARGERSYDIFSRLLKDRIIFIGQPIDDALADVVIAQLLFCVSENKNQDISVYINSPGGEVTAGLAIYDTMQFVQCDIATYCIGQASSMAAVLLAGGSAGKRHALPNSRIMLHQPWGGVQGTAADILVQAEELSRLKETIYRILGEHTGKSKEQLERDCDRDFFMSAQEALEYGIVDEVIQPSKKKGGKEGENGEAKKG